MKTERVIGIVVLAVALVLAGITALAAEGTLVVATSDYMTGNVTTLKNGGTVVSMDLLTICGDNAIAAHGGHVYVIERYGADNIIKLSADDIGPSGVVYQYSVGNGSNPQDMAFVSDRKAYVSRYEETGLWIVDPSPASAEGFKIGDVDLSAYADADGCPEMSPMALAGDKLYVACQRMDQEDPWDWVPLDAKLVIVDTATDEITGAIVLEKGNPQTMVLFNGLLYVACGGSLNDPADGGIEVIDTGTDTHVGVLITEAELGGNVAGLVVRSSTKGYVIAGGYDEMYVPHYAVYPFDPSTGAVGVPLPGPEAAQSMTLGGDGLLYVADRSLEQPGVYVYDASDELLAGPIATGLPPNALVWVGATPAAVAEEMPPTCPGTYALEPNYPNPFNPDTIIPYRIAGAVSAFVDLSVYSVLGERVAVLVHSPCAPGQYRARWDGTDNAGNPVASGVYVARLNAGGAAFTAKLVLVR